MPTNPTKMPEIAASALRAEGHSTVPVLCQRAKWCQKPMSPDLKIKKVRCSLGLVERACGIGVIKRSTVRATEDPSEIHTNSPGVL